MTVLQRAQAAQRCVRDVCYLAGCVKAEGRRHLGILEVAIDGLGNANHTCAETCHMRHTCVGFSRRDPELMQPASLQLMMDMESTKAMTTSRWHDTGSCAFLSTSASTAASTHRSSSSSHPM